MWKLGLFALDIVRGSSRRGFIFIPSPDGSLPYCGGFIGKSIYRDFGNRSDSSDRYRAGLDKAAPDFQDCRTSEGVVVVCTLDDDVQELLTDTVEMLGVLC